MRNLLLACVILLTACSQPGRAEGEIRVVDGDTLHVRDVRIRLAGIDAPEKRQVCKRESRPINCGAQAAQALRNKIFGKRLRCKEAGKDQHGRVLATCYADGEDINRWLVREGWALAYPKYDPTYLPDEAKAKAVRRNIWSTEFKNPEDWRSAHRARKSTRSKGKGPARAAQSRAASKSVLPQVEASKFSCAVRKTCKQMSSCEEAYFYLKTCDQRRRDRDRDGIPCENICPQRRS